MGTKRVLEAAAEAEACGFTTAAEVVKEKAERARKLAVAYEHYRYVTEEQIQAFNERLMKETGKPKTREDAHRAARPHIFHSYEKVADQLVMVEIAKYKGLPPREVIQKVKEATARGCFDGMEVAEIAPVSTQVKLPDPIVFGRVEGCGDRFFIAEWGSDVSISDLIGETEG